MSCSGVPWRSPVPARRVRPPKGRVRSRRAPGTVRAAIAGSALIAIVALVVVISGRKGTERRQAEAPGAVELIRGVAERAGCPSGRITVETTELRGGSLQTVTIHAPKGLRVDRLVLDLQAAAHNSGGRVEPRPLAEGGGYGLARLEGRLAGEQVRVVVLGEEPRPRPKRRSAASSATARLVVILDDAGNSLSPLPALESLPSEVAVAVLPNAAYAEEIARALGHQRRELLVHMPMEPQPGTGPGCGPGALEVGQDPTEVRLRVERALAAVPGARGMNNHMGSKATADPQLMGVLMEELKLRGLYFVDSRTSPETVALETARRGGVPARERDVFLDVVEDPQVIRHSLAEAVAVARTSGSAIAIGHVHPLTIEVLSAELPVLASQGVRLVRPSALVRQSD